MKVACVLITHLRAKVELRRHPSLKDRPAIIVDRSGSRALVVDFFPATVGVSVEMTLEEALSRQAGVVVLEADEPSYQKVFHQALDSLQGISDRMERSELGIAYVRLDGLKDMYDGEARLVTALLNSVPLDLKPRVGVGDGKFPALVAALTSRSLGATKVPLDAGAFLAPHSIDLLPIPAKVRAAMHRFGLRTMGDVVASMKEGLLTDQFGAAGRRAWQLCHGVDDSPLVPLKYEESIMEHASLPFSSTSMDLLLMAVGTLLKKAYARPMMRGRCAGMVELKCILYGAPPWENVVHFKQGAANWERASSIIGSQLEADHPQAPVEEVTLTLLNISGGSGVQMSLLQDVREGRERRLLEAERQMQARTAGKHALYRVVDVAPWHPAPEMRALQVPIDPAGRDGMKSLSMPTSVAVQEGPDQQPVAVRLGKRWHQVGRIDDLWSFDLWWMPTPLTRTYYRISREDGKQITLFRDQRGDCWYQQVS